MCQVTERKPLCHPPVLTWVTLGTAKMENDDDHITEFDPRLKYDTTGPVPILLVPQPSDDPDDPLVCQLKVVFAA